MLFFSWDFFSHELRHGLFHSAWLMQYTRFHHGRAPEPKPFHTAQKERPPCLLSLRISWKKEWSLFPSVCTQSQHHVHSRLLSQGQKLAQLTVRPPLYSCRYEHEPNASSRHTYCVFLTESAHPFPTVLTIPFTLTTLPNVCLQTSLQRYGPACSPVLLCWDCHPLGHSSCLCGLIFHLPRGPAVLLHPPTCKDQILPTLFNTQPGSFFPSSWNKL